MYGRRRRLGLIWWIIGGPILVATLGFIAFVAYVWFDYWDTERNRASGHIRKLGFENADRTPRWSSDGGYIIANLGNSVYRVEFPGGEVKAVLQDEDIGYYSPSLSPDGRLAYNHYDPKSGKFLIQILDSAGKQTRTLATDDFLISPLSWSPDGSRLLYRVWKDTVGDYLVLHSEDSPDVARRDDGFWWSNLGTEAAPGWSYDSQRFAIRKWDKPVVSLVTIRRDGTGMSTIDRIDRENAPFTISAPGWTARGELYYAKFEPRNGAGHIILYRAAADGRDRHQLLDITAEPLALTGELFPGDRTPPESMTQLRFEAVHYVKPSPDGKKILLHARTTTRNDNSIYVSLYLLTIGDRTLVRIPTRSLGTVFASWSPDGQWIAVCDLRLGSLFVVNSAGDGYRLLLTDDANAFDLS